MENNLLVTTESLKTVLPVLNNKIMDIERNWDEIKALRLVAEMGLVSPVQTENGSLYTDENGIVYTL